MFDSYKIVCDTQTLPFFQWQDQAFSGCAKSLPYAENYEEDYTTEQNDKFVFSVFPNPTSSNITISSEKDFHTIEIVDILGRVQKIGTSSLRGTECRSNPESDLSGLLCYARNDVSKVTIDVSHLSPGIYFVRIITNTGTEVQKFVKYDNY